MSRTYAPSNRIHFMHGVCDLHDGDLVFQLFFLIWFYVCVCVIFEITLAY